MARNRKLGMLEILIFAGTFGLSQIFGGISKAEEFFREKYSVPFNGQEQEIVISGDLTDNTLTIDIVNETEKKRYEALSEEKAKKQYSQDIATENIAEISPRAVHIAVVSSSKTKVESGEQRWWILPDRKEVPAIPLDENPRKPVMQAGEVIGATGLGYVSVYAGISSVLGKAGLEIEKGAEGEHARKKFEELTKIGEAKVTRIEVNTPRGYINQPAALKMKYEISIDAGEDQPTPYLVMDMGIPDGKGGIRSTPTLIKKISLEKELAEIGEVNTFSLTTNDIKTAKVISNKNGKKREVVFALYDLETGDRKFLTPKQIAKSKSSEEEEQRIEGTTDFFVMYDANSGRITKLEGISSRYELEPGSFEKTEKVPRDFSRGHFVQEKNHPFIIKTKQENYFLLEISADMKDIRYKRLPPPSENQGGKEK